VGAALGVPDSEQQGGGAAERIGKRPQPDGPAGAIATGSRPNPDFRRQAASKAGPLGSVIHHFTAPAGLIVTLTFRAGR
jgi:hypothetical protein